MKTLQRICFGMMLVVLSCANLLAQGKKNSDWDAAYKKLMSNPEARAEIEAKGASREEVIAWLKEKSSKGDNAYAKEKMSDTKKDVDWDAAYEKLLKDRPDIARKVANGGATKEQVIAYMKNNSADKGGKGRGKKATRADVKDPRGFRQEGEAAVFSGPQAGEKLPSFKVIGLHGKRKGQEYDPVKLAAGKPLVLIFQDNQVPGQKGLLLNGQVLTQIAKNSPTDLEVHSIFLVDDPTPENVFEYDFKDKIPPVIQMGISKDRRDGPGSYGLNRNLGMTIIVARDGKVLHNFPMAQPMLYPNPYVLGAIAEAIDVKPDAMAGWFGGDRKADSKMMAKNMQDRKKDIAGMKKEAATKDKRGEEEMKMERRRKADRATDVPRRRRPVEVKDPAGFAKTQKKEIFSGPQPGEKLPSFKATSLLDDNQGDAIDLIKDTGDNPQILIFQDRGGVGIRGLFGVTDAINKIKQKHKSLTMSVVFLDDDKEHIANFARRFTGSLKDRGMSHVAISDDGRDGPGNYGLNRSISQTIILAKGGKVTRNFVFPQGLLYADPYVMGGVAELVGADREEVAKLVAAPNERERQQMAARARDAEYDPQSAAKMRFREKLGEFVRNGKLNREEAGELWNAAFGDAAATDRPRGDRRMRDRPASDRPARDRDTKRDATPDKK